MGEKPIAQRKNRDKKYWKLGEWKKLTAYERQQILDDCKTWNLGRKKTGGSGK